MGIIEAAHRIDDVASQPLGGLGWPWMVQLKYQSELGFVAMTFILVVHISAMSPECDI